jgi:hypothetical protein
VPKLRRTASPLSACCPEGTGAVRLHKLQVLAVTTRGIAHNVVFQAPHVFEAFQLSQVLEPRP